MWVKAKLYTLLFIAEFGGKGDRSENRLGHHDDALGGSNPISNIIPDRYFWAEIIKGIGRI
jgi:hypothetical protein